MVRLWQTPAGRLLIAFVFIDAAIYALAHTAGSRLNTGQGDQQLFWIALDTFLVWRIWRGGRIAWGVLVVLCSYPLAVMLVGAANLNAYVGGLIAFTLAQILILLSPAVRRRVQKMPVR